MKTESIEQFYESVASARKAISFQMRYQHSSIASSYPSFMWKIKSIKLHPKWRELGGLSYPTKRRLYIITFEMKKHVERKGHPFRNANTYELKYPYKGSSWQKVQAMSATEARRKFVKGTTYKPNQVKLRRVY
jgi:hypothetical protein